MATIASFAILRLVLGSKDRLLGRRHECAVIHEWVRLVATSCVVGSNVACGDLDLDLVGGRLGARTVDIDDGVFHLGGGIGCMKASGDDNKDRGDSEEKVRPRHRSLNNNE